MNIITITICYLTNSKSKKNSKKWSNKTKNLMKIKSKLFLLNLRFGSTSLNEEIIKIYIQDLEKLVIEYWRTIEKTVLLYLNKIDPSEVSKNK
jgi:hypothetical protein